MIAASRATGSSPRGRGKPHASRSPRDRRRLIPAWAGKTHGGGVPPCRAKAHPRVGGENRDLDAHCPSLPGSSPRGRGKHSASMRIDRRAGLIPAWAGKTRQATKRALPSKAHPRVGGENPRCYRVRPRNGGSSPRGRGKRQQAGKTLDVLGLIPAWAGKTDSCHSIRHPPCWLIPAWAGKTTYQNVNDAATEAHPRVGGENETEAGIEVAARGSSPRGRGKPASTPRAETSPGLIPAWAGKTRRRRRRARTLRAHPRVGGENPRTTRAPRTRTGSSPRGRGKRPLTNGFRVGGGLIPAWAGKTGGSAPAFGGAWAHPRVGGENGTASPQVMCAQGSSPRGRGKRGVVGWLGRAWGLIPAWAGKTSLCPPRSRKAPAHPRVGGENALPDADCVDRTGSSPRGRGKLRPRPGRQDVCRLIPAWAGKTRALDGDRGGLGAHPRVGGENGRTITGYRRRYGSSPRGRGKPAPLRPGCPERGLIPAWAGKTF